MMIFFFAFFFLLHPSIQRGSEEKAALSLSLSLSRFNTTFSLRFRPLSMLRFAERISLVYSIVKIEMIDFDSILFFFPPFSFSY
jgi:hypothetical protein